MMSFLQILKCRKLTPFAMKFLKLHRNCIKLRLIINKHDWKPYLHGNTSCSSRTDVTDKAARAKIDPVQTHQSAEPFRWVPTCDIGRLHSNLHVLLHGHGFGLASVIFPCWSIVCADQRLTDIVLAESQNNAL